MLIFYEVYDKSFLVYSDIVFSFSDLEGLWWSQGLIRLIPNNDSIFLIKEKFHLSIMSLMNRLHEEYKIFHHYLISCWWAWWKKKFNKGTLLKWIKRKKVTVFNSLLLIKFNILIITKVFSIMIYFHQE